MPETAEIAPGDDFHPPQFHLRQMLGMMVAGCVVCFLAVGIEATWQRTLFLLWGLAAGVQFFVGRWAEKEPPRADPNRADAYDLVALVARISLWIWLLFSLALGAARLLATRPQPTIDLALNILSVPLAIWLAVTIVACFVSLLLYFEWRDRAMVILRLWAPLTVLLPLAWFLINHT